MADDLTSRAMYLRSMASVKAQEGNFVKGAAVGAVASVPRTFAALTDMMGVTQGAERDIYNHWEDKVDNSQPGTLAGFNFGSVFGDAAQTVADPIAGVAKGIGIAKAGLFLGARGLDRPVVEMAGLASHFKYSGKTAMELWQETKWFNLNHGVRNAPIELATHVSVANMAINPLAVERLQKGEAVPFLEAVSGLDEVTQHKGYKELLQDYVIVFEGMEKGTLGSHSGDAKVIMLNTEHYSPTMGADIGHDNRLRNTLTHEIQHAIQKFEKWIGTGANTSFLGNAAEKRNKAQKAVLEARARIGDRLAEVINKKLKGLEPLSEKMKQAHEKMREIQGTPYRDYPGGVPKKYADLRAADDEYLADKAKLYAELDKILPQEARVQGRLFGLQIPWDFGLVKYDPKTGKLAGAHLPTIVRKDPESYDLVDKFYKTDLGEIWARQAGRLWGWTKEQVDKLPPWRGIDVAPKYASGSSAETKEATGLYKDLLDIVNSMNNP
jgi:hypothetical protein